MQVTDHDHDDEDHDTSEYDEHVWLSLKNAERFVNEISESLVSLDSANADAYSANAKAYNTELEALDKEYSEAVSSSTVKTLLFCRQISIQIYGSGLWSFILCSI